MASPAATALVDVWILAGQSNTVGDNAADGTPIPAASQPLPGLVLAYDSSGTWRDAAPSVHANIHGYTREPSCGPDIAFARTLISLGLSSRVGLVPTAKGATSLFRDWRPGGGGGGAELYGAMIARTRAALAAPLPGGGTCRLRGMIWVQGEADAEEKVGPKPSESYAANFAAFVQAVRRDLSSYHAQIPIIMGVMAVRKRECFPYIGAVRQAQLGLSLPGLLRVDLAGFEFFEEYGGFHVHLTKDGCTALGAAMAHVYYAAAVRAGLPRRTGDALTAMAAATHGFGGGTPVPGTSSGGGGSGGGSGIVPAAVVAAAASTAAVSAAAEPGAAPRGGARPDAEPGAAVKTAVAGAAAAPEASAADGEQVMTAAGTKPGPEPLAEPGEGSSEARTELGELEEQGALVAAESIVVEVGRQQQQQEEGQHEGQQEGQLSGLAGPGHGLTPAGGSGTEVDGATGGLSTRRLEGQLSGPGGAPAEEGTARGSDAGGAPGACEPGPAGAEVAPTGEGVAETSSNTAVEDSSGA